MQKTKETLIRIYDAVNWIKTKNNSPIYDACENVSLVEQTLLNLIKVNHPIKKMYFNLDKIDSFSGYTYSEDMYSSMERTKLILTSLKMANIDVGFNYTDLEKFVANVVFYNRIYIESKLYKTSLMKNKLTPFFDYNLLSTSPAIISKTDYELFFTIFSVKYNKIKKNNIFKLIKFNNQYISIYYQRFVCNISNYIEEYFLKKLTKDEKDKYFKVRGKNFEKLIFESFKMRFETLQYYPNATYFDENGQYELDQIIVSDDWIIIIDDKSSSFVNNYAFIGNENEKLLNLKRSFGKGFISLSKAYKNFKSKNKICIECKNKLINLNLEGKQIFIVMITLNEIKSISGSLSKICKDQKLDHLPLLLSYSTLFEIFTNVKNIDEFLFYFKERDELINKNKNISFDVDEIDAYGMIMSDEYSDLKKKLTYIKDLDLNFMVGNSIFRKTCNSEINAYFLKELSEKYFKK